MKPNAMHLTLSLKLLHCAYEEVWYKETLYEAKPSTEPTLNDTYLCVCIRMCVKFARVY